MSKFLPIFALYNSARDQNPEFLWKYLNNLIFWSKEIVTLVTINVILFWKLLCTFQNGLSPENKTIINNFINYKKELAKTFTFQGKVLSWVLPMACKILRIVSNVSFSIFFFYIFLTPVAPSLVLAWMKWVIHNMTGLTRFMDIF